jgi:hypothetical protein
MAQGGLRAITWDSTSYKGSGYTCYTNNSSTNVLSATSCGYWIARAHNLLLPHQNGTFKTTFNGSTSLEMIGLQINGAPYPASNLASYCIFTNGNIIIYENGSVMGTYGTYSNQELSITRSGDSLYYYKGTTLLRKSYVNSSFCMSPAVYMHSTPRTCDNPRVDFIRPLITTASITEINPEDTSSRGSITLDVQGGIAPYTINWDQSVSGTTLTGLLEGQYSAWVKDSVGDSIRISYRVGLHLDWFESVVSIVRLSIVCSA